MTTSIAANSAAPSLEFIQKYNFHNEIASLYLQQYGKAGKSLICTPNIALGLISNQFQGSLIVLYVDSTPKVELLKLMKGITFVQCPSLGALSRKGSELNANSELLLTWPYSILVAYFQFLTPSTAMDVIIPVESLEEIVQWGTAFSSPLFNIHYVSDIQIVADVVKAPKPVFNLLSLQETKNGQKALISHGFLGGVLSGAVYSYYMANKGTLNQVKLLLLDSCFDTCSQFTSQPEPVSPPRHPLAKKPINYAVVEDLQLPEATTIFETDSLESAYLLMKMRDFSQLPVVNQSRKVVGLLTMAALTKAASSNSIQAGRIDTSNPPKHKEKKIVSQVMNTWPKAHTYTIVTLSTPLVELEALFLKTHAIFITDDAGKFPLGVVTREDVLRFLSAN